MEKSRTSNVSQAAWILAVFLLAWPAFLFWNSRDTSEEAPPPRTVVLPTLAAKLVAVGLPADPDLEALPPFFALWADKAYWRDGKTLFAYKHPVTGEYSFYFEATRTPDGFRFREIAKPVDPTGKFVWTEDIGEDCPFRFFVTQGESPGVVERRDRGVIRQSPPGKITIDLPKTETKIDVPVAVPELAKPATDEKKPTR